MVCAPSWDWLIFLEQPKSPILAISCPFLCSCRKILADFRSLWITLLPWQYAKPAVI